MAAKKEIVSALSTLLNNTKMSIHAFLDEKLIDMKNFIFESTDTLFGRVHEVQRQQLNCIKMALAKSAKEHPNRLKKDQLKSTRQRFNKVHAESKQKLEQATKNLKTIVEEKLDEQKPMLHAVVDRIFGKNLDDISTKVKVSMAAKKNGGNPKKPTKFNGDFMKVVAKDLLSVKVGFDDSLMEKMLDLMLEVEILLDNICLLGLINNDDMVEDINELTENIQTEIKQVLGKIKQKLLKTTLKKRMDALEKNIFYQINY